MILYSSEKSVIFCDPRTSGLFDVKKYTIVDRPEKWGEVLSQQKVLEIDPQYLTVSLKEKIEKYGPKITLQRSPIAQQRMIKTPEEIEKLRLSQSKNKSVYEHILPFLVCGVSEKEIARKILILELEQGASGPSFPPIVAF